MCLLCDSATRNSDNGFFFCSAFPLLERKSNVEASNRQVVADCQKSLASMTSTLDRRIKTFGSIQSQFSSNLTSSIEGFAERQSSELDANISNLNERLSILSAAATTLSGSHSDAKNSSHSLAAEIDQARESLLTATHERTSSLREACSVLAREVVEANGVQLEEVKECFSGMAELMKSTLRSVESHVSSENERISEASDFARSSAEKQIASLHRQNEALTSMLLEEREQSRKSTEELGQNIMKMLMVSSQERDDRISSAVGSIQQNITSSEQVSKDFVEGHDSRTKELFDNRQSFFNDVVGFEKKARKHRKKGDAAAARVNEKLGQDMGIFSEKFEKTIAEEEEECKRYTQDVGARMDGCECSILRRDGFPFRCFADHLTSSILFFTVREQSDAAHEAQNSQLQRLVSEAREGFGSIEAGLQLAKEQINETVGQVVETVSGRLKLYFLQQQQF